MLSKKLLSVLSVLFFILWQGTPAYSQACTTLGQTPATAFPVCGSATFTQSSVPACLNSTVRAPCSSGTGNIYQDLNPYWYKFTCFTSGTLALTITPKNLGDDYDWQIFDVTGHDPSDVYSNNASLLVACNWSGLKGVTGTKSNAASLYECGSTNNFNPPIFSKMPNLVQGHNYLLLISHFTGDQQSGYDLSFVGGTASITDTVQPALKDIRPICDGSRIRVILNKKMKCKSLASDGSDFAISPAVAHPIQASGNSFAEVQAKVTKIQKQVEAFLLQKGFTADELQRGFIQVTDNANWRKDAAIRFEARSSVTVSTMSPRS